MKDLITLTITTYNRLQYLQPSLQSLESLKLPLETIILDDASEDFVQKYIKSVASKNKWNVHFNESNLGSTKNNIKRAEFVKTEWMYITDSDVLYSSLFASELEKLLDFCVKNDCIGSLFNTQGSGRHTKILNQKNSYLQKESIGGVSMLIKTNLFKKITKEHKKHLAPGFTGWDYAVVFYSKKNNIPIWVSKDSYVEHIGAVGAHSNGLHDKAINFVE